MLLQEKRKTKSYNYLKYYLNCFLNLLFYNFIYITEILHIGHEVSFDKYWFVKSESSEKIYKFKYIYTPTIKDVTQIASGAYAFSGNWKWEIIQD